MVYSLNSPISQSSGTLLALTFSLTVAEHFVIFRETPLFLLSKPGAIWVSNFLTLLSVLRIVFLGFILKPYMFTICSQSFARNLCLQALLFVLGQRTPIFCYVVRRYDFGLSSADKLRQAARKRRPAYCSII